MTKTRAFLPVGMYGYVYRGGHFCLCAFVIFAFRAACLSFFVYVCVSASTPGVVDIMSSLVLPIAQYTCAGLLCLLRI